MMKTYVWLALALLLAGCGPIPPPPGPPPVPPPAVVRAVGALVRSQAGQGLAGAVCRLQDSTGWLSATSSAPDGYALWPVVLASLRATHVECAAEGYLPLSESRALATDGNENLEPLVLRPAFVPLPRLMPEGQHFRLADGGRITLIQASDFNLLNRWQHGEDIEPILQQRQDAGFNMLRVWTLMRLSQWGIGDFTDIDYARVPAFLDVCARHGMYVELTAYTSTFDPTHWGKLTAAITSSTNSLAELVNEEDQPANRLTDMASYAQPSGVLSSHGSNGAESAPVAPFWSYATFHTNGASEEQRKVGHNAWEIWSGPTLTNETSRYPDVGMWRSADVARSAQLAYDSAAAAALLAAGSVFHSVAGKASVLWDAATEATATAWANGAKSVPLACQQGDYKHRGDLETPELLRVYQRGNDPACIVRIRR